MPQTFDIERFGGLPLALATAGDYISQTADSFGDYLHMYEQSWEELAENSDGLQYELFRKGAGSEPDWFCDITKSKARFNKAMATLHGYSLIEAMPGHYSLHACVHDWVLESDPQDRYYDIRLSDTLYCVECCFGIYAGILAD
ncbi:hypothetical protein XPA_007308 [Xanthoria parietina]